MFYLYPIVKGSANCDTVCGFDNTFHGMIHPSVNTRKKLARWGGFAFFWRRSERYRVSLFIIAIFHYPAFLLRS
ncbi:hypothetical protein E2A40_05620 [Salmonella enterica subsp. enterica serovar Johannesburg]|uniref:Uncharacterized protein n=7 Tax=Salmonella enterica TaxID=28901 RepID=A0A606YI43_SALET|nr:hypothetical protein LFZ19_22695 [Salmonella enterica subsp. enterica serovar Johannesburg str. ST203]ATQ04396.1 hypothetical protein CS348_21595 [Salmonella enterica subsp. enterica serovar Gaminara]AXE09997.1 hypothetical protein LFZ12_021990 [Salmonella enterica subsp. enterica serovar Gaminara str. SA20063285]EAA1724410.1 hypothetical protein [Salmonella enterica subsp. enterica serovar Oranienburg]EAA2593632.1 hypothetical protein [Salmonella enterica subsp. enterica serovar Poona]EAA5